MPQSVSVFNMEAWSGVGVPEGSPHRGNVDRDLKGGWTSLGTIRGGWRALQSFIGRPWRHGWEISDLHVNSKSGKGWLYYRDIFYTWERTVAWGRLVSHAVPLKQDRIGTWASTYSLNVSLALSTTSWAIVFWLQLKYLMPDWLLNCHQASSRHMEHVLSHG